MFSMSRNSYRSEHLFASTPHKYTRPALFRIRDKPPLDFRIIQDCIFSASADAVLLPVTLGFRIPQTLLKTMYDIGGEAQIKEILDRAKIESRQGNLFVVDVTATSLPTRYIILVEAVYPTNPFCEFEEIFRVLNSLNVQSVATMAFKFRRRQGHYSAIALLQALKAGVQTGTLDRIRAFSVCELEHCRLQPFRLIFLNHGSCYRITPPNEGPVTRQIDQSMTCAGDRCAICYADLNSEAVVEIINCRHHFHAQCFESLLNMAVNNSCCPLCKRYFALPSGTMPLGSRMTVYRVHNRAVCIDGARGYLTILYEVYDGFQTPRDVRPGKPYKGGEYAAYLPNTSEGLELVKLLRKAFLCGLTFKIEDLDDQRLRNVLVWNISHKTSLEGGEAGFGYPDPCYCHQLRQELHRLGITQELDVHNDELDDAGRSRIRRRGVVTD